MNEDLLNLIKKLTCYNQGKLVDYLFSLTITHNKMAYELVANSEKKPRKAHLAIVERMKDFDRYMISILTQVVEANFSYAAKYFQMTGRTIPRMCIKLFKEGKVFPAYRSSDAPEFTNQAYAPENSTAFSRILNGIDKYYINNNIPESLKDGYLNSRLDLKGVKTFLADFQTNNQYSYDQWRKCWKKYSELPNDSFFKSTLVVPLNFVKDEMSHIVRDYFRVTKEDESKLLFGFLCFDTTDINFFNPLNDANFCFVIADFISLYVIFASALSDYSEYYNRCGKFVERTQ